MNAAHSSSVYISFTAIIVNFPPFIFCDAKYFRNEFEPKKISRYYPLLNSKQATSLHFSLSVSLNWATNDSSNQNDPQQFTQYKTFGILAIWKFRQIVQTIKFKTTDIFHSISIRQTIMLPYHHHSKKYRKSVE